jgi:hypothetical protein
MISRRAHECLGGFSVFGVMSVWENRACSEEVGIKKDELRRAREVERKKEKLSRAFLRSFQDRYEYCCQFTAFLAQVTQLF